MKTRILIVEDERDALDLMEEIFTKNGFQTLTAQNGVDALNVIREQEPDIMISDIYMPEMDGMQLLNIVSSKYPDIAVIMITAEGSVDNAVEAMKKGARDYILKPLRLEEILHKVNTISELKSLQRENQSLRQNLTERFNFDNIIGRNPKMTDLFEKIKAISQIKVNSTVLIRGENGTGKELIANAIHFNSDRIKKPFITVNCAVLSENLLESELFGHVKGAFTGAIKDKPGRFEMADGGTIFLDEIGDISPSMQLKLLRVLQEKEVERVGGTEVLKVDVRIIAATNRNLEEAMEQGDFRQDLYYRLDVIPIVVPPLRERQDDIPVLVDHFIDKFSANFEKPVESIDDEVIQLMKAYRWPGNIRELENLIERAIVLAKSTHLARQDFPEYIMEGSPVPTLDLNSDASLTEIVDAYEKQIILRALAENGNNKLRTAEKLKIHRSTFMSKLKKYDIN